MFSLSPNSPGNCLKTFPPLSGVDAGESSLSAAEGLPTNEAVKPRARNKQVSKRGVITSTNFPGNYPNNHDKTISIATSPGDFLTIKFTDFALEVENTIYYGQLFNRFLCLVPQSLFLGLGNDKGRSGGNSSSKDLWKL